MSRQIKFRVWDSQNKSWLQGKWCNILNADGTFSLVSENTEKSGFVVQQSTELKDSTGKEIYEGDIIQFAGRWDKDGNVLEPNFENYQVIWFSGALMAFWVNRNHASSRFEHNDLVGVGHTDCKIVGNIFENSELC